ncbi:hypothetical protein GNE08_19735 [Trichormus variabilis ARAD]|nr:MULTISPECIES: hypothetical protein [Nostocaceae]MBC1216447.1 hypothetical protein [Trichormus variabilis ARAD]MBC1257459.1 hypothetical protein [Trichormus variabilis V5]MBC1266104.1 hypothetical protein [Trichormus variabilis FSR]MBC1304737.1 hypothetical protein [Trichormus variabilis N2B]MBC1326812.1 hypothetical protein [Trichormus variabilis 9RC]
MGIRVLSVVSGQWLVAKSLYQECFGVFGNGYVYPLIMHLLFGAIAGIIGSGLIIVD